MIFAGLPLNVLLGIFGGVAAAVVVLYILKLRRRVIAVPFSPLWHRVLRDKEATSLFSKLKRLLSLLLQLALLFLLIAALAQPKCTKDVVKSRRIVVLVDTSASMQSLDGEPGADPPVTRLDAAKKKLRDMVRGLNGVEKMLIAQMDARVTPLGPMTDEITDLDKMIEQLRPTETRADFPRALRFAIDALRDKPREERPDLQTDDDDEPAEIVVMSDGKVADLGADGALGVIKDGSGKVEIPSLFDKDGHARFHVDYMPFGSSDQNAAVTQFSVRRYPLDKSHYEAMLEVKNTTPFVPTPAIAELEARIKPVKDEIEKIERQLDEAKDTATKKELIDNRAKLTASIAEVQKQKDELERPEKERQAMDVQLLLYADGHQIEDTKLRIRPGEALPRFFQNLSAATRTVEVRLESARDMLPADNHAYALLPERRRAKVLMVSDGNTYLEAALLLDEYLDVSDVKPAGYAQKIASNKYDVIIFDRVTPEQPAPTHALYFDPRGPGSPVKSTDALKLPEFNKIEPRKHPVIRYTALDDVNIALGHKLVPEIEKGDKALGTFNDAKGPAPILVAGTRKGNRFVAVGFDVRDSDLALRPAWPLFVINTINWFMDEDSNYLSSFRTGDVWRVPVVGSEPQATLTLPVPGRTCTPDEQVCPCATGSYCALKPESCAAEAALCPGSESVSAPIHENRAVFLGEHAGFYRLATAASPPEHEVAPDKAADATANAGVITFAANLLDEDESTIAPVPRDKFIVNGVKSEDFVSNAATLKTEWWIYLLLAAAIVTALEWATYHRRLTV